LISNIPAVGTGLLGVLTVYWLRSGREKATIVFRMLFIAGSSGTFRSPSTSICGRVRLCCSVGGLSLVTLAFLYWVAEIKQWREVRTTPILVFGINAVAGVVTDALVWGPGYSFNTKVRRARIFPGTRWPMRASEPWR
jgi:predicted acyltransferase